MPDRTWLISEGEYLKKNTGKNETVFVLANGYRSLRGTSPFIDPALGHRLRRQQGADMDRGH